jgi:hypothetical protein
MRWYVALFASLIFLCLMDTAYAESPISSSPIYLPESIKAGGEANFSVKITNTGSLFASEIRPVVEVMPKSAGSFVHVTASANTTLWGGYSDIVRGTIQVNKEIPHERIFVAIYFVAKDEHGRQILLVNSENSFALKIEHDSASLCCGKPLAMGLHHIDLWEKHDLIFDGTIVEANRTAALNSYHIIVNKYFKTNTKSTLISASGNVIFASGDRALFYINRTDSINLISPYSVATTRDLIPLSTLPGEPIGRGGPTLAFLADHPCKPSYFRSTDLSQKDPHRLMEYTLQNGYFKYFVPYAISGGKLHSMQLDCTSGALLIHLQEAVGGTLTITIPRKMLDSRVGTDMEFIVIVDGLEAENAEIHSDEKVRTMEIQFNKDSNLIEVITTLWPGEAYCGTGDDKESQYYRLLTPLQQLKSGISSQYVVCGQGMELAHKASNGQPVCIRPETKQMLLSTKWAEPARIMG